MDLHDTRPGRYVLLSFIGLGMIALDSTIMGPAFPSMMKEFNIPLGMLGFLASAWNMGYIFTIVGGSISDRYGEPPVLALSFILVGCSTFLVSIAPNYVALVEVFLLAGLGAAFAEASMNPLIARLYPEKGGFALNFLHVSFCIGAFLGPAMAGVLIVNYGSWRLPYLVAAAMFTPLMIVGIIMAWRVRKHERISTSQKVAMTHGDLTILGVFMFAGFFYFSAELGTNAWLPSFLIFERTFPTTLASLSICLFWAFMGISRLLLGRLTDRFGYKKMILLSSMLGAVSVLAGTLFEDRITILALWSLSGFAFGPIYPTMLAWANTLFSSKRGLATGSMYSIGFLGAVFSPWFLGALGELYSLRVSALYLTFSAFAVGLSALWLRNGIYDISN